MHSLILFYQPWEIWTATNKYLTVYIIQYNIGLYDLVAIVALFSYVLENNHVDLLTKNLPDMLAKSMQTKVKQ